MNSSVSEKCPSETTPLSEIAAVPASAVKGPMGVSTVTSVMLPPTSIWAKSGSACRSIALPSSCAPMMASGEECAMNHATSSYMSAAWNATACPEPE